MTSPDHPLSPENPTKPTGLRSFSLQNSVKTTETDISRMNQSELLALHAEIEAKLVGLSLSEVNLEKETLIQLQRAKQLQVDANSAKSGVPMNQRAQVQNSLANILGTLTKMQHDLHSSESLKRLKAAVIKVVKAQSVEFQTTFFELLEIEFQQAEEAQKAEMLTEEILTATPIEEEDAA